MILTVVQFGQHSVPVSNVTVDDHTESGFLWPICLQCCNDIDVNFPDQYVVIHRKTLVLKQQLGPVKAQVHHIWFIHKLPIYARPTFEMPPAAYSSKGRKVTRKTIGLVTLKSTKGKLTLETVTQVIVCIADNDHQCSVPVVAQLVKEQVRYDVILLNNKLYPILDAPSTRGDFW